MPDRMAVVFAPTVWNFVAGKCRSTYWKCVKTVNLSFSCPEKKVSGVLNILNHPMVDTGSSAVPVMCLQATRICANKTPVGFRLTFPQKPTPSESARKENGMKGNRVSLVGAEGKAKQRDLRSLKPQGQKPLFPVPALRATPGRLILQIQQIYRRSRRLVGTKF